MPLWAGWWQQWGQQGGSFPRQPHAGGWLQSSQLSAVPGDAAAHAKSKPHLSGAGEGRHSHCLGAGGEGKHPWPLHTCILPMPQLAATSPMTWLPASKHPPLHPPGQRAAPPHQGGCGRCGRAAGTWERADDGAHHDPHHTVNTWQHWGVPSTQPDANAPFPL